jgi:hypothetical protein
VLGLDGLELDGDLFSGSDVDPQVDDTERTGTYLSDNTIFVANTKILFA